MSEPQTATVDPNLPVSVETGGRVLTGVGVSAEAIQQIADDHAERRAPAAPDRDEKTGQFKPERPSRGAKRFQELDTAAKEAQARAEKAESEREALRKELDAARATPPAAAPSQPAPPREAPAARTFDKPKPKFDDFATTEDPLSAHAEAVAAWTLDKYEFDHPLEARIAARLEAERAFDRLQTRVRDISAKGKQAYDDFETVIATQTDPIFSQDQLRAIVEADGSEHLQYALAKNPAEAKRIAGLDPISFGMALAKLIPARPVDQAASTARPVAQTNAPPPIQPVGTGTRTTRPALEELAASGRYDEYKAARRAQLGR